MTSPQAPRTIISVRADAHRRVAPDAARISIGVRGRASSKSSAREAADRTLKRLTAALTALGGTPESTNATEHALSWSVTGVQTWQKRKGRDGNRSAGHRAELSARVTVREFGLLSEVERALAADDDVEIRYVSWRVDDENPAWAQVRSEAIRAALLKGKDYAAALGGAVLSVEHVADAGLLERGGDHEEMALSARASSVMWAQHEDDGGDELALDPAPQRISATIEARFVATTGPLPSQ